jgi:hypothetical protein
MGMWRPVRAGVVTTAAVSLFWLTEHQLFEGSQCAAGQTQPYGCLGGQMLAVVVGVPLLVLIAAVVLAGKGLRHSVVGAVVSLAGAWVVVDAVLDLVDFRGSEFAGQLMTAPTAGVVAAVWSIYGPAPSSTRENGAATSLHHEEEVERPQRGQREEKG